MLSPCVASDEQQLIETSWWKNTLCTGKYPCVPLNCILRVPRELVSQNKRRFQKDGFDLDLSYITPRIIVMGFPSAGIEHLYRNPRFEVVRFFNKYHNDHYEIYNFCSEVGRRYSAEHFDKRVQYFPFQDHCVPTLKSMMEFGDSAAKWLDQDPQNVVGLHCKAGKGRAGLMTCVLLLRVGASPTAEHAISIYNKMRVTDGNGLTVPSQQQWVKYYELTWKEYCNESSLPPIQCWFLDEIQFHNYPTNGDDGPPLYNMNIFRGYGHKKELLCHTKGNNIFSCNILIQDNTLLEFQLANKFSMGKSYKLWIHTNFIDPDVQGCTSFSKNQIDDIDDHFPPTFSVMIKVKQYQPNR